MASDPHSSWTPSAPPVEGEGDTMSNAQRSALKWEKEEALGEMATVAPVLYTNINFPNLKEEFPGKSLVCYCCLYYQLSCMCYGSCFWFVFILFMTMESLCVITNFNLVWLCTMWIVPRYLETSCIFLVILGLCLFAYFPEVNCNEWKDMVSSS